MNVYNFGAANYFNGLLAGGRPPGSPLTSAEALVLQGLARIDARKLLYSSLLTFSDAIAGIEKKRYTWATVQLYYCSFYSIRALLSDNGAIFFHILGKPFTINLLAGEVIKKPPSQIGGSTHKWSFFELKRVFPTSPLLGQQIDGIDPFDWMMKQREDANYRRARFPEPNCPDQFQRIAEGSRRSFIEAYLSDEIYAFDQDHAIVAFPIHCLNYCIRSICTSKIAVADDSEMDQIESYFADKKGKLTSLIALKNRIGG